MDLRLTTRTIAWIVLLAWNPSIVAEDVPPGCVKNILNDIINVELLGVTDPSTPRTYRLCENVAIDIGTDCTPAGCDGGDFVPIFFRPNVNLLCGASGRRDGNCTLRGGEAQLVAVENENLKPFNINYDVSNLTVSGVTFEGGGSSEIPNVGISVPGENVLFRDCVWKHNKGISSFFVGMQAGSSLQGDISVTIEDSLFEDNLSCGHSIWANNSDVKIIHNRFENNTFNGTCELSHVIMHSEGSTGQVEWNCFTGNSFKTGVAFKSKYASVNGYTDNYASENSLVDPSKPGCDDGVVIPYDNATGGEWYDAGMFDCTPFELESCFAPGPSAAPSLTPSDMPSGPTAGPTLGPSAAPLVNPTIGPSWAPSDMPSGPTAGPTLGPSELPSPMPVSIPSEPTSSGQRISGLSFSISWVAAMIFTIGTLRHSCT